ncbi:MAG: hypothetical protein IPO86_06795 [Saprospiraceae bacterium]|nr:hypothetical protein [Saprospiraceae bacterium]MBK9727810.1 hypothetical protein [Saprospiraceae bacterium]
MRNSIKTLLFTTLCVVDCYSQLKIGLKGGINYGKAISNLYPNETYSNAIGYRAGLTIGYKITSWEISTGGLLSFRGACDNFSSQSSNCWSTHFIFIEIPIIIYKSFYSDKFKIGIGLVNGFTGSPPINLIDDREFEVDGEILLAWNITKRFNLELSYLFGGIANSLSDRDTHLFSVGNLSFNYTFFKHSFRKQSNKVPKLN